VSRGRQYGFDRRRRDAARRQKQQAKRERKLTRAAEGVTGPDIDTPQETGAPSGVWEWFSPSRGRVVSSTIGTRPDGDPPDDWVLITDAPPDETDTPS
jgi:hypothetical protein